MQEEPLDLIDFDQLLSEEHKMVRKLARGFAQKEVQPLVNQAWEKGDFPEHLPRRLGEMGFLGANLKGYGCQELDSVSYGLVMQELERVDSGLRSFASVQGALCMWPILNYGSDEQKEKYLPRMATGELIGCFGLTEPDFGSDPSGMLTNAKSVKGGYVLNGNKMWITNGAIADISIIWAKHEGEIKGFLVEKGTKGLSSSKIKNKLSLRVSSTAELNLKDCFVPESSLMPRAIGLKAALFCLNQARFGIGWGVLGAANSVYQCALAYAKERRVFEKPLASYQLVQAKLVEMAKDISLAQLLMFHLSQKKDVHQLKHYQVSLAKMNNCSMALKCARMSRDILGASGIVDEYPVMRHMLNLETVNTYEGTEDIHRLILGKEITKENAIF